MRKKNELFAIFVTELYLLILFVYFSLPSLTYRCRYAINFSTCREIRSLCRFKGPPSSAHPVPETYMRVFRWLGSTRQPVGCHGQCLVSQQAIVEHGQKVHVRIAQLHIVFPPSAAAAGSGPYAVIQMKKPSLVHTRTAALSPCKSSHRVVGNLIGMGLLRMPSHTSRHFSTGLQIPIRSASGFATGPVEMPSLSICNSLISPSLKVCYGRSRYELGIVARTSDFACAPAPCARSCGW